MEGQASVRALYDAVREYMEIGVRVGVLNEKLAVAEDLVCPVFRMDAVSFADSIAAWCNSRPPQ